MPVHFMDMITTLLSQLPKRKDEEFIFYQILDFFFKVFDNGSNKLSSNDGCQNSPRGGPGGGGGYSHI